ncbi:hypothetical protein H696_00523 [Fonticula alba]|uniref:Choline/carnitine acyltransferase domain-containing protein n=1 Tax=Fonticula alba TaxID=691883 RepID=A0A058ZF16_FONAL|nr:hypothetical protein H696_00523 [Fonticula alba]KCV72970.1 hypothetical protein H696_00523 [Fonticula alba]|eukprot:XP_009492671.1 hypothetical protein H696_00523 [Fonticula alba]
MLPATARLAVLQPRASYPALAGAVTRQFSSAAAPVRGDDDYIHPKSPLPTMHYQASLLRLPIPKLENTVQRYLNSVTPLLTPEQLSSTKIAVVDFFRGVGPDLHHELVANDKKNKHTSYISGLWYDMYLRDRAPLPLNYNPQITLMPSANKPGQAERAAAIIRSTIRFRNSLAESVLAPEVFHTNTKLSKAPWFESLQAVLPEQVSTLAAIGTGAYPLDMSQFSRLLASTRIPKPEKDELVSFPESSHVAIMFRNQIYKLELRPDGRTWLNEGEILAAVQKILATPAPAADIPAVGILTSDARPAWAAAREHLAGLSAKNAASLKAVDSALFMLCLDDTAPTSMEALSREMLTGSGRNRWFDKSFSMIINRNGTTAINFEHAWGDGVAVLRYLNDVFEDSERFLCEPAAGRVPEPELLGFDFDDKAKAAVKAAEKRFDAADAALRLNILDTEVMNRQWIKNSRLSPDGFMQMAFQLAYARLSGGKAVSTYESANTAAFKHGRTECIRSATNESKAMSEVFLNPASSQEQRAQALRTAVERHQKITVEALMGQGFDRHLFALRKLAEAKGMPTPAIFTDAAYGIINQNILSTSTLSSPTIDGGAFGPVHQEGYGIGYGMNETTLRFNVTSYQDAQPFLAALETSLHQMRDAVEHQQRK